MSTSILEAVTILEVSFSLFIWSVSSSSVLSTALQGENYKKRPLPSEGVFSVLL